MSADSVDVVLQQPRSRRACYRQLWVQTLIAMAVGIVEFRGKSPSEG